jgi:D-lyxose ketol-isomerase
MITKDQQKKAQEKAIRLFEKAQIPLSESEKKAIEVVDFGLSNLSVEGAQILTLVQTERISVKLLALMPNQTEPEHWHPRVGEDPGKEETVRHVYGDLLFYVGGEQTLSKGFIPEGKNSLYTCRREIQMEPGSQLTLAPGEKHWFQAGKRGAVLFSFSTVARDALDQFTDPDIVRITQIADE